MLSSNNIFISTMLFLITDSFLIIHLASPVSSNTCCSGYLPLYPIHETSLISV